ncbi:MAG: hypothetical protein RLY49_123 [Candidatus Parcubacteria bacterium]|jgi:hypothetical protein
MNIQKGFASILLILAGLILIGGGAYYFISTSKNQNMDQNQKGDPEVVDVTEETKSLANNSKSSPVASKWETQVDSTIGYEISYPAGWWDNVNSRVVNPERAGKPDTDTPMEKLSVTKVPTETYDASCKQGKNSILNGYPVLDSGWEKGYGLIYHRTICQKEKSIVISISVFDNDEGNIDEKSKQTFENIFSTFKFLKDAGAKLPEITYLSSIKSIPESANGQIISGKLVYVIGKNIGGCTNAKNCELLVHIGDKTVNINPTPYPEQTTLTFNSPIMENGNYDLYIENLATGLKSNIVKVKVGLNSDN